MGMFAFLGCVEDQYYQPRNNADETIVSLSQDELTLSCGGLGDCQPYDVCIVNGTVMCKNNACVARLQSGGDVKLSCVVDVYLRSHAGSTTSSSTPTTTATSTPVQTTPTTTVSSTPSICGQVTPPPEAVKQAFERASCSRGDGIGMLSSLASVRPWADVTADIAGSTITVKSITLYGVLPNKTVVPISGSAVTWAGYWQRSPTWFPFSDEHQTLSGPFTGQLTVPTNPYVLHFGNAGAPVGSYIDFFTVIEFQTTGDAKVAVGLDGYNSSGVKISEIATGNWYACTSATGTAVSYNGSLADPCSNQIGILASTQSSTPSTTTVTSSGCPSTGIQVTAGPSLLNACSSGLYTVTWDGSGALISSSAGAPLATSFTTLGFAHVTTVCAGSYRTSWPALGSNAVTAGFSRICSAGKDITNTSIVCDYPYGSKLSVALNPSETGRCQ